MYMIYNTMYIIQIILVYKTTEQKKRKTMNERKQEKKNEI